MNRQDVEQTYDVDADGTIRSPGRFEGEPWWAVVVDEEWAGSGNILATMNEGQGEYVELFDIAPDDDARDAFGLASETVAILYCQSNQGFVTVEELSAQGSRRVRFWQATSRTFIKPF